jgi:hypothetical protein
MSFILLYPVFWSLSGTLFVGKSFLAMLNPTQEVLTEPPKRSERPPSPAERTIALAYVGRIVAIASGIAFVLGIGVSWSSVVTVALTSFRSSSTSSVSMRNFGLLYDFYLFRYLVGAQVGTIPLVRRFLS